MSWAMDRRGGGVGFLTCRIVFCFDWYLDLHLIQSAVMAATWTGSSWFHQLGIRLKGKSKPGDITDAIIHIHPEM